MLYFLGIRHIWLISNHIEARESWASIVLQLHCASTSGPGSNRSGHKAQGSSCPQGDLHIVSRPRGCPLPNQNVTCPGCPNIELMSVPLFGDSDFWFPYHLGKVKVPLNKDNEVTKTESCIVWKGDERICLEKTKEKILFFGHWVSLSH